MSILDRPFLDTESASFTCAIALALTSRKVHLGRFARPSDRLVHDVPPDSWGLP